MGLQELKMGRWVPILTDKDGGFVLVEKEVLWSLKLAAVNSRDYEKIHWTESLEEIAFIDYNRACSALAMKFDDKSMLSALLHDRLHGLKNLIAVVGCTMKSHKSPGHVVIRPLHCARVHFMKPGMRLVASTLREVLSRYQHILKDSDQLVKQLRHLRFPPSAKIIKFDIKDFFMSGRHSRLVAACTTHAPENFKGEFAELLTVILSNQFVALKCEKQPDAPPIYTEVRRVLSGSGMGLLCSGEVSDVAFLDMVEIPMMLHSREANAKRGILYYGRFKDDAIMLVDSSWDERASLCAELQERVDFFQLVFEVSSFDATMLDVCLMRVAVGSECKFEFKTHTKVTNQWQPLSNTSMHPSHVHLSWPRAMIQRFHTKCTKKSDAMEAEAQFIQRLQERCPTHASRTRQSLSSMTTLRVREKEISAFILPYRYAWTLASIPKILSREFQSWAASSKLLAPLVPRPRLSWKLGGRHLGRIFATYKDEYHEESNEESIWR